MRAHGSGVGVLLIGLAVACSGTKDATEPGGNAGGAGAAHSGAGGTGDAAGQPDQGGDAGAAGQRDQGGDGGDGGAAAVQFWTDVTQHIEISCFGFFDGVAKFRADRADLSAEQRALLAGQLGVPGSSYDGNDDQIHCVVTTRDTEERELQFTIDGHSELIGDATNNGGLGGEGGAGPDDYPAAAVLGCEFHHPDQGWLPSFSPNPRCVRELEVRGGSSFGLALATPSKAYHVELIHCTQNSLGDTTVQLFGADPDNPLATAVAPTDDVGPDDACLVLDAQVDSPVLGHLVFSSARSDSRSQEITFR